MTEKNQDAYWPGFVVVSIAAPHVRFSSVLDTRKQAVERMAELSPAGSKTLKVVAVRIFPEPEPKKP